MCMLLAGPLARVTRPRFRCTCAPVRRLRGCSPLSRVTRPRCRCTCAPVRRLRGCSTIPGRPRSHGPGCAAQRAVFFVRWARPPGGSDTSVEPLASLERDLSCKHLNKYRLCVTCQKSAAQEQASGASGDVIGERIAIDIFETQAIHRR